MELITTIENMRRHSNHLRERGKKIAFVPTMGYLHEGHLSLFRIGRGKGDCLVVSIFVNPTQFSPGEDLETYPRDFERDLTLSKNEGVDVVFAPGENELYPENFQTYIQLEKLPDHLCGISRPTFFRGVSTVVTKLFNIVNPHAAVFGEKDFQQLAIVRRLVKDLNMDIEIIGGPIIREPDGLAMSSRNSYLTSEQRRWAMSLSQALKKAQAQIDAGAREAQKIIRAATELISSMPETVIDYISICDPDTLDDMTEINRPVLMALSVKVGATRLIDNTILKL